MELFNMSELKICTCIVTLVFLTLFLKNLSHEIRIVKAGYHEKRSRVLGLLLTFLAFLVGVISLFAVDPQVPCIADNNPSDEYVELVSPSNVDLYYTLDNTLPDKNASKYHDKIHVSHTSELRVVAIDVFGCRSDELQTTIVSEKDEVLVTDGIEFVWVSKQEGHLDDLADQNDKMAADVDTDMCSIDSTSTVKNKEPRIVLSEPSEEIKSESGDDKIFLEEDSIEEETISDEAELLDAICDDALNVKITGYQLIFEYGKCYGEDLILCYDKGIAGCLELSRELSQEVVRFAIWDEEKVERHEVEFYLDEEYCFIVKLPDEFVNDSEYSLYVEVVDENGNVLVYDDTVIMPEKNLLDPASAADYNDETEENFFINSDLPAEYTPSNVE